MSTKSSSGGKAPRAKKRVSKSILERAGYSSKSERYASKSAIEKFAKGKVSADEFRDATISKRQYQQSNLKKLFGGREKITLEKRAKRYAQDDLPLTGWSEQRKQVSARARDVWAKKRTYKGESIKRIREHEANIQIKNEGGTLDRETWLKEKAFAEAHADAYGGVDELPRWFNYGKMARPSSHVHA